MEHQFSKDAKNLVGSPMFKMMARVQELEKSGKKIIHFEIGDPDFSTPQRITDAAIDALKAGETHYVNSSGMAQLRDAICDSTEKDLGWRPEREQVVVAPAISFIYFTVRALVNPGEEVIVAEPGYSSYFSTFDFIGVKAVTVPVFEKNNFRLAAADLEKAITPKTRLVILTSPSNPTGAMMTKENLTAIYKLAEKHNFYILSDEVYKKMTYDLPFSSISANDRCQERVIILDGFSKAYAMTGWRLGYSIAPKPIAEKLGLMIQTVISNVPPFIQLAGVEALSGDQSSIKVMMDEYRKRKDVMIKGFNELPGVSCIDPDGAFYAFPNIQKTGMTSKEFAEFILEKANVALLPGTDFGPHGEGYLRVTFATSLSNIEEGLRRMKEALSKK
ncbi:MAG: pyridoxal phosphate-dependent aminotransferase [bacterium]|nr:pyridoxal phosphate-dependent aminotransferase [bacterium]